VMVAFLLLCSRVGGKRREGTVLEGRKGDLRRFILLRLRCRASVRRRGKEEKEKRKGHGWGGLFSRRVGNVGRRKERGRGMRGA